MSLQWASISYYYFCFFWGTQTTSERVIDLPFFVQDADVFCVSPGKIIIKRGGGGLGGYHRSAPIVFLIFFAFVLFSIGTCLAFSCQWLSLSKGGASCSINWATAHTVISVFVCPGTHVLFPSCVPMPSCTAAIYLCPFVYPCLFADLSSTGSRYLPPAEVTSIDRHWSNTSAQLTSPQEKESAFFFFSNASINCYFIQSQTLHTWMNSYRLRIYKNVEAYIWCVYKRM